METEYLLANTFLMGDNRHHAMDSRYIGFIDEKDVIGTIIGH